MCHISNYNIFACTIYDPIMSIILFHIHHIGNGDIFGNEYVLCEFILNVDQLE